MDDLRTHISKAVATLTDALSGSFFIEDDAVDRFGEALDECQAALALIDGRFDLDIPVPFRLAESPFDITTN